MDIRILIMDVDGVLTDCKLYIAADGTKSKAFNIKDGYGIKACQQAGIKTAIISGRNDAAVNIRAQELSIDFVFQGITDKIACFDQLMQTLKLTPQQAAYIGDDMPDLELLQRVGLSAAPADAHTSILTTVDYICAHNGGEGAVRDLCDHLLKETLIESNNGTLRR